MSSSGCLSLSTLPPTPSAIPAATAARQEAEQRLETRLRAAWAKPVGKTCTAKDVARLVQRIDLITAASRMAAKHQHPGVPKKAGGRRGDSNGDSSGSGESKCAVRESNPSLATRQRRNALDKLIVTLGEYFGEVEAAGTAIRSARRALQDDDQSLGAGPDLSRYCERLIDVMGGDGSASVRVLKCIHQNVLFLAILELKEGVLKSIMTKDSRGRDGWRVKVKLEEGRVQICHVRKEELVDTAPGHVMWEMSMTFNPTMTKMCSVGLRLTGLELGDAATPKQRATLTSKLSSGDLIIR